MTNITRFDPFEDALPDLFRGFARMPKLWREHEMDIKIDVAETDKQYKVKAEIPGVSKEDINVAVDGNMVTIAAEVKKDAEEKDKRYLRRERFVGAVSRSFMLSCEVDEKAAEARYVDGVLELTLPKRADTAARKLTVQ